MIMSYVMNHAAVKRVYELLYKYTSPDGQRVQETSLVTNAELQLLQRGGENHTVIRFSSMYIGTIVRWLDNPPLLYSRV